MPRILIVDDEASIRALLTTAFGVAGYEVRTAPDGPEAMALCETERFDAVLSDVVMPKMNGHELARWIAALTSGHAHDPHVRLRPGVPGVPAHGTLPVDLETIPPP